MRQMFRAGGFILSALLFTGCGPSFGSLTGLVTFGGKPVVVGTVTVVDSAGVPHGAAIQADGRYLVNNIPTGPVTIAVDSPDPRTGPATSGEGEGEGAARRIEGWRPLPPQYADAKTSGLKFELKQGSNTFDLELTGSVPKGSDGKPVQPGQPGQPGRITP